MTDTLSTPKKVGRVYYCEQEVILVEALWFVLGFAVTTSVILVTEKVIYG